MESQSKSESRKPISIFSYWVEATFFVISMLLIAIAVYHQSLIGDLNAYRSRPVLVIEGLALIFVGLCLLIQIVRACIAMVMSEFPLALQRLGVALLLLLTIVFSIWIDIATLLYAT